MKEAGFLEKRAMKGTTGLVYVSKSRQEEILEYYGQGVRPKCHVVPPGVDINRFRPGDRAWTGEGPLRTVTVCRLSVEKNIQCLIRAVALLKKRGLRTESVIVGEGPLRSQLEQLASDEGVTDRVSFAGGRGDVDLFYRQADVFVLPSINEGFALAYLEAFASGLPAIAIRNCPGRILVAADEIIDHKRTGLLIDDDSPELLAEALLEVYQNPDRRSEWGRNARETCEKKFTWEQAVGRMLAISQNR
jgi:glycosyltransferase involved in cell wall biosynthesis